MPRFVILEHAMPAGLGRPLHWDLMLEFGGGLATWALCEPPALDRDIQADRLADHRLAYLDYEGPISEGRGAVSQWDAGECELLSTEPARWEATLAGGNIRGRLLLTLESSGGARWLARFQKSEISN